MTNDERAAERERIIAALTTALERGYTPDELREWLQGAVDFNASKVDA